MTPRWQTHDEIRIFSMAHGKCPICFGPSDAGYACKKHGKMWQEYATHLEDRPNNDQYLDWVNKTYDREHTLRCAECGATCPVDDYLCEGCRQ
jgi:hypothetical protein